MAAQHPLVALLTTAPQTPPALPLDEVQRAAVEPDSGAQLVIGPAGSGKSAMLAEALALRLRRGVDPGRLLGLVPDQAAARRWRMLLAGRTGGSAPPVTTLHGLALQQVRDDAASRHAEPPRLLAAADRIDIVAGVLRSMPGPWPDLFAEALSTRRFAERVTDFIDRAALAAWTPRTLAAAGGPEVWPMLAQVWREYTRVLALADAMDYPELLARATDLLAHRGGGPWHCIVVDGYAELDPQQIALLRALRPPGRRLLAAADPDTTTDRFRGAAGDAVPGFSRAFADAAPLLVLPGSYRFAGPAEDLRCRLASPLPLPGVPAEAVRRQRAPRRAQRRTGVDALSFTDPFAEAAGIAALVRRFATAGAAQGESPRWEDAAVLARTAGQLALLEQAMLAAGVPVAGAAGGRLLLEEPVVAQLATGLRFAAASAGLPVPVPEHGPLRDLLTGGMAGIDPFHLRRLLLRLRRDEAAAAAVEGRPARSSRELLVEVLRDPASLGQLPPGEFPAVRGLLEAQRRLSGAAEAIGRGAEAAEVLWTLWSDDPAGPGSWARRLRGTALAGGPGAAAADRDLDAAIALFAEARRSDARGGGLRVLDFLGALPGARTPGERLAATASRSGAVTLLTAHRAKGRQWPLVVVAGVQEGVWPGDSAGLGLLAEELLADRGTTAVAAREAQVADERRLFLLACSRASQRLVVTCVAAGERDPGGSQPSRFVADLEIPLREAPRPEGPRPAPLGAVVHLRTAAAGSDPGLRDAALARLSALQGDPDFPWAQPSSWWSLGEPTVAEQPLVRPGEPVALTVTGLAELTACPWRWFVTRMLHGAPPAALAAGVGRLVHRVHEAWANAEIERTGPTAEEIVDRVWPALPFEAGWQSDRRRAEVLASLERLLRWQQDNAGRIAFAERPFEVDVALPGGAAVRLRGKVDLGLRSGPDALAVLDVKTTKSPPTRADVERHVQLAGYQAAVAAGALADASVPAGAGLLLASVPDGTGPKVLWQPPLAGAQDGDWFGEVLLQAVQRLQREDFPAIESASCRTCPVTALCPAKSPAQGVGA